MCTAALRTTPNTIGPSTNNSNIFELIQGNVRIRDICFSLITHGAPGKFRNLQAKEFPRDEWDATPKPVIPSFAAQIYRFRWGPIFYYKNNIALRDALHCCHFRSIRMDHFGNWLQSVIAWTNRIKIFKLKCRMFQAITLNVCASAHLGQNE